MLKVKIQDLTPRPLPRPDPVAAVVVAGLLALPGVEIAVSRSIRGGIHPGRAAVRGHHITVDIPAAAGVDAGLLALCGV